MKTVLIVSVAGDRHTFAVAETLQAKGARVCLWFPGDFPTRSTETFLFNEGPPVATIMGPEGEISLSGVDTVWYRRAAPNHDFSGLHPADVPFVARERRRFREGAFRAVGRKAFWVNPVDRAIESENKLYQQAVAQELGVRMPRALFSNSPADIRTFLRAEGGRIVYKSLDGLGWRDGEATWACHTVALAEEDLVDDQLLEATPGIYQEFVEKDHELRITMVGNRPFAAKVLSQETTAGKVDWRRAYGELRMEAVDVSPGVLDSCRRLMRALGLAFGCFDFVVTPSGHEVFLEVNQMGQFLFIEQYTGMPLLDAFAEYLIQGRADFAWKETASCMRYGDVEKRAAERATASKERHVGLPERIVNEEPVPSGARQEGDS